MLSFNIILLCLVLVILIGLTYHLPFVDGFADSGSHTKFVEESNRKAQFSYQYDQSNESGTPY